MNINEAVKQATEKFITTSTADATQHTMTQIIDLATLHSINAETHQGSYVSIYEAINQITK